MTRYVFGYRASRNKPAYLKIDDRPPIFVNHSRGGDPKAERVQWPGGNVSFRHKRGVVQEEWRDEWGRHAVARVFPEEFAEQLANVDANIAELKLQLAEAEAGRQQLLDMAAGASKPLRVEPARKEREEYPRTERGMAEAAKREAESEAMRRSTREMLNSFQALAERTVKGR